MTSPFPVVAGQPITPAVLNHAYTYADTNSHTVTAASYSDLSSIYTIPAWDAAVGMSYELTAFGNGTTGSSAQTMQFGLYLGSSIVGVAPILGSSAFATSEAFRWEVVLKIIPASIGPSGTWFGSIRGVVTESPNAILPGAGSQDSVPFAGGNSSAYSQDTTVPNAFGLQFQWGGTSGSPTITCTGTRYTRCG
jgi:hypothetical protein